MNDHERSFLKAAQHYSMIPVLETFSVSKVTSEHLYSLFQAEAFCLLESNDHESPWSRFSFIGLHPFLKAEEKDGDILLFDALQQRTVCVPSLTAMCHYVEETYRIQPLDNTPLPFVGGAIGYIGYEYALQQMKIVPNRRSKYPLVSFYYGQNYIAYDRMTNQCHIIFYVYTAGECSERDLQMRYKEARERIRGLKARIESFQASPRSHAPSSPHSDQRSDRPLAIQSDCTKDEFFQRVMKVKQDIAAGQLSQAVISQRFTYQVDRSGADLYRALRTINPSPYLFHLKFDDLELIGSSPERLLKVNDGWVEMHPIAGTRKRGETREEDRLLEKLLRHDGKEQQEHAMLVELAKDDLKAFCQGESIAVQQWMEPVYFSHVIHLVSKVTGRLMEHIHPVEALLKAMPAGTVSGVPKQRATQMINQLESTSRDIYGGAIAYIGFEGNIDSCIAIRTMMLRDQQVHIQAGAGIVSDSDPASEYHETLYKAKALIAAVQLAQSLTGTKGS